MPHAYAALPPHAAKPPPYNRREFTFTPTITSVAPMRTRAEPFAEATTLVSIEMGLQSRQPRPSDLMPASQPWTRNARSLPTSMSRSPNSVWQSFDAVVIVRMGEQLSEVREAEEALTVQRDLYCAAGRLGRAVSSPDTSQDKLRWRISMLMSACIHSANAARCGHTRGVVAVSIDRPAADKPTRSPHIIAV